MLFVDALNRLRMRFAIMFSDQAEKERDQNKNNDLLFCASKNESLHSTVDRRTLVRGGRFRDRSNMDRVIFAADILVVEARFRFRRQKIPINGHGHVEIAVDCAIDELDLQRMKMSAISDGRQAARLNRSPMDARHGCGRIGGGDFRSQQYAQN
jgi:hypothetical protein